MQGREARLKWQYFGTELPADQKNKTRETSETRVSF